MFTIVPFIVLAAVYFNRKMKEQFRISAVQLGEINAQVEDSLLGVRVVKSFANEELEKEKFEKGNQISTTSSATGTSTWAALRPPTGCSTA